MKVAYYGLKETSFGFDWGPMSIERVCSDDKGGVVIAVKSNKETVDIRVTPSGLMRISSVVKRSKA